jgi:ferredoxin
MLHILHFLIHAYAVLIKDAKITLLTSGVYSSVKVQGLVKNGVAHQISASEAEAKIDRAAELGLVGQSLWVEVEQYLWGIQNEHMEKFLEFCFCCPCCCTALHVTKNSTRDVRSRFKSLGWMAEVNDNCINCGKCIEVCPQHAIKSAGEKR